LLGSQLDAAAAGAAPDGSFIAVCATDAPLAALQLRRLALPPLLGLARAGSYASNGSGEMAERLDGTMQEGFPIEAVRRLAEARANLPKL
jgi:Peptidase family S58